MKTKINSKMIAATGMLTALIVVFQFVGNSLAIGPVSINLTLLPIIIGAILYGPYVGLFLGIINGVCVILSPSTQVIFIPITVIGTIFTCIFKTGIAGLLAGLVANLFKKRKTLGSIISSLLVPVVNTSLFALFCILFFQDFLNQGVENGASDTFTFLIFGVIGWNFIFEMGVSILMCPIIVRLVNYFKSKKNKN